MAVAVSVPITQARRWLDDTASSDWADAELLGWYNNTVLYIFSQRPDTRIDTDQSEITYAAASATTDNMIFGEPEKWTQACAHGIVSQAFSQDAGDERDAARAAYHQEQLDRMIAGL